MQMSASSAEPALLHVRQRQFLPNNYTYEYAESRSCGTGSFFAAGSLLRNEAVFCPISSVRRHLVTVLMRKEKACMAVQAFLLKGKEFRLTTDNEKEKGNWLLLKNHLFFTLSIIKFFYELCMKSFPINYERFVTPSPKTTPVIMNKL